MSVVALTAERYSVGRSPESALCLPYDSVSRAHAELVRQEGGWLLRDLQSANGTSLNGEFVTEAKFTAACRIQFGDVICQLATAADVVEIPAMAPGPDAAAVAAKEAAVLAQVAQLTGERDEARKRLSALEAASRNEKAEGEKKLLALNAEVTAARQTGEQQARAAAEKHQAALAGLEALRETDRQQLAELEAAAASAQARIAQLEEEAAAMEERWEAEHAEVNRVTVELVAAKMAAEEAASWREKLVEAQATAEAQRAALQAHERTIAGLRDNLRSSPSSVPPRPPSKIVRNLVLLFAAVMLTGLSGFGLQRLSHYGEPPVVLRSAQLAKTESKKRETPAVSSKYRTPLSLPEPIADGEKASEDPNAVPAATEAAGAPTPES